MEVLRLQPIEVPITIQDTHLNRETIVIGKMIPVTEIGVTENILLMNN
jgi:hypothetical protein